MNDKVVKFPDSETCQYSLEELVNRVHKLAENSDNVWIDCSHAKDRKKSRNVTTRQIFDVLRSGKGVSGPTLDKYGDWRIKLKRYSAGRTVQVVIVVKNDHVEIITVI